MSEQIALFAFFVYQLLLFSGIKPEPRRLDATTRLYSPFGIGTSIDFHYAYYYRMRYAEDERLSSLGK